MGNIEKNHVSLLSHIIYVIYNNEDLDKMRLEVIQLLKYAVPFDTANFFLVEPDIDNKRVLTNLVNSNSLKNSNVDGVLKKYMEKCAEIDNTHWICNAKKSITYRATDLISEAALEETKYYKEMFIPYDLHFGAQLVLAYNDSCVGLLTLFRSKESGNFSDAEIFLLDNLKEHLAVRIHCTKLPNQTFNNNATSYSEKYNLTPRECEILNLLFQGLTDDSITKKLFISENTLRRHLYNLFHKLNITQRWELSFMK